MDIYKIKTLIISLICVIGCYAQCESIEILELPFVYEWCEGEDDYYEINNSCFFLDPICGCWDSLNNPQFFTFTTGAGGVVTLHITGEIYNNAIDPPYFGSPTYYAFFDACPFLGGNVLSYPTSAVGTPFFNCWEYNSSVEISSYIAYDINGNLTQLTTDPTNLIQPSAEYYLDIILQPNTEYFLYVGFPGSQFNSVSSWGCIEVEIFGPLILGTETPLSISEISNQYANKPFNYTILGQRK
jgi:hypothetical protein